MKTNLLTLQEFAVGSGIAYSPCLLGGEVSSSTRPDVDQLNEHGGQ